MTATVVIDILERYKLNSDTIMIRILTFSTTPFLGGTTAELLPKEKLSVTSLMYGMMLPSGNDAAQSLAIYFGNLIL
jgi:D-alanyl-D-alanine carboxypeptidase